MATDIKYCDPEGPIIDMFEILVTNDIREITMLTNSQLIEILKKEFYMDTVTLHSLELDIYLNVLKKYLKRWPGWDPFEQSVKKIKVMNDKEVVAKILKKEYVKLKEYLQNPLNLAQELANNKVKELKEKENLGKEHIVMEVEATRQQLNNLFYRRPVQKSIFNAFNDHNRRLHNMISLESIINWYGVETRITLKANDKYVIYVRRNPHRLKHTLVNKKLGLNDHNDIELDQHIQVKSTENSMKVLKAEILKYYEEITYDDNSNCRSVLHHIIKNDLNGLPNILDVPCSFRKYVSKYRYIRYLYRDVPVQNEMDEYDLQLEEMISPMSQFDISFSNLSNIFISFEDAIKILCTECRLTFTGKDFVLDILKHFNEVHYEEPDWSCLKCHKVCSVPSLTLSGWSHTCN